jgi:uncharacterized protein (TIGR02118 family)
MIAAAVCYRQGINVEYYLKRHVPRSEELMVPLGLLRSEVRQFLPGPDGSLPPYAVMSTLYYPSLEVFQATMQNPIMAELMDDVKNFYDGAPEILIGEVLVNVDYVAAR